METETHSNYGATISEPSHAEHEANALDSSACPRCYPRQYANSHARHRQARPAEALALLQTAVGA